MSEQLIANGRYRLVFSRSQNNALGSVALGIPLGLVPESGDNFTWEVTFNGTDSYTLRNLRTGVFLGDEVTDPVPLMTLRGSPTPWPWRIERAEAPETFNLSPKNTNGSMRLVLSLIPAVPPQVASLPATEFPDQSWRLEKV
jgi:hypothetical protein